MDTPQSDNSSRMDMLINNKKNNWYIEPEKEKIFGKSIF